MSGGVWAVLQFIAWIIATLVAAYIFPYIAARGYHEGKMDSWSKFMNKATQSQQGEDDGS